MVKIRKIQQAIMGLDGGEYQEIMNDYLHKKFKYSNMTCLGSEAGTSKTTRGIPDTYIETNDGKYILIMYGTVEKQSFNKIRDDIIDAYNKDKSYIDENRIEKVICCYTSNNINIAQREELKSIFENKNVELIGIDDLSYDIAHNFQSIAKTYLDISIDSGQFCDIDEFIEKHDKNSTNAPINIDFIDRKEKGEVLDSLIKDDLILIIGKAGTGKTKLSIEVCKEYIRQNKETKCLCIKNNGNDIYEDLGDYIENGQDYLIFIDDINEMNRVKSFMDFIKDKKDKSKIKILATVRDYLLDNVITKLKEYYVPNLYILDKMDDDKIKRILEDTYSIRNQKYQEKILEVSNGNPRLAVLSAKGIIDKKITNLNSVIDIFQGYYFPVIRDNDLSDIDIKILFFISLLGPINIEDDNILKMISKFQIDEKIFIETVKKLSKWELVDYFEGKAAKTSDQNFSNYIVYKVLIEDKIITLSELITKLYPNCILKIINAINMIYGIFYSVATEKYIVSQIKEIWENEPYSSDSRFLYHFYNVDRIKAIKMIKKEIDDCEGKTFNLKEFDFHSKENNQRIDDKKIEILSNFKYGELEDEAIDLLIEYYKKRPDLIMDFYFAFILNLGIDEHSNHNNFETELKIIDKFMTAINFKDENMYNLSYLLIKIIKDFLKYERHITKQSRKKLTINYIRIALIASEEVYNFRKILFENLGALYKDDEFKKMVEDILLDYHIYPSDEDTNKIFKKDLETLNTTFFRNWGAPDFIQCDILKNFEDTCKRIEIGIPEELKRYKENHQYLILHSLELERDFHEDWKKAQKDRQDRVIALIKDYKIEDFSNLFEICKIGEEFKDRLKMYNINYSILDIFNYLIVKNKEDFLNIFKEYINKNAPFTLSPDVLIENILKNFDREDILDILNNEEYEKKELFLNSFYSIIEDIKEKDVEKIFSLLDEQVKQEQVYILDINSLLKYEKIIKGTVEKYCEKLFELYNKKTFIISKLFWRVTYEEQEDIDRIINSFSNIEILEDLYIIGSCNLMDYKGKFGISLLKNDDKFLYKIIENMKEFRRNSSELYSIFNEIWKLDNYEYYIDKTYSEIENKYFNYFEIEKIFYKEEKEDKDILIRKEKWIEKYIQNNYQDNKKIANIFGVINTSFPSKKKEYILQFLKLNKSIEDFKRIPLFSTFSSWSGSEVPIIEKKIKFLEELNKNINGLDYIEHMDYINSRIGALKKYITDIKIREYLEDYL